MHMPEPKKLKVIFLIDPAAMNCVKAVLKNLYGEDGITFGMYTTKRGFIEPDCVMMSATVHSLALQRVIRGNALKIKGVEAIYVKV